MSTAVEGHTPRQGTGLLDDLPMDPLAQAWQQILAAVLAEGPPEDPFDGPGDRVTESLRVLRVAGAPVPVGDLDEASRLLCRPYTGCGSRLSAA